VYFEPAHVFLSRPPKAKLSPSSTKLSSIRLSIHPMDAKASIFFDASQHFASEASKYASIRSLDASMRIVLAASEVCQ